MPKFIRIAKTNATVNPDFPPSNPPIANKMLVNKPNRRTVFNWFKNMVNPSQHLLLTLNL